MEIVYKDYYSEYEAVHNNAKNALSLASSSSVTRYLTGKSEAIINAVIKCKITGYNDNVVSEYNSALDDMLKELENVSAFSQSYSAVEQAYIELKQELDALEQQNQLFKSTYNSKPNIKDSKYIMVIDGIETNIVSHYYSDLGKWKNACKCLNDNCDALAKSVQSYIDYLSSINALDAKDGKIPSTIAKPNSVIGELKTNDSVSYYSDMLKYGNISKRLSDYGYKNIQRLTGEQLEKYCETYGIGPSRYWGFSVGHYENGTWVETDRIWGKDLYNNPQYNINISVFTCEKSINGVTYTFAFAYDDNKSDEYHIGFEDEMGKCVEEMYLIPDYCHKQLQEYGLNTIVLKESEICDCWAHINDANMQVELGIGGGSINGSVFTNYFPGNNSDHGVFLHELGHQFDKYSSSDLWINITGREDNPYLDEFANGDYKWDDWNAFSYDEKKAKSCEHFAECFRRYWKANDRLKFVCPESYAELEKLMQEAKEKYQ